MTRRILALACVLAGLVAFDPEWIVVDWTRPAEWIASARFEDAAAASVRSLAIALAASQLAALGAVALATVTGNGTVEHLARRALIPALRRAAPLALLAGTALPAAASEPRLPIIPPAPAATSPQAAVQSNPLPPADAAGGTVVVVPGDSLWKIAARHTDGAIGPYWLRVVELNRHRFEDVDLIHPGDEVVLPINPAG